MNHSFFTTDYTTERLTQSGNKSSYAAQISGRGFFMQASDEVTTMNSLQIGDLFILHTESLKDIVVTDRVTISGIIYEVKGVRNSTLGSFAVKKVLLVKNPV